MSVETVARRYAGALADVVLKTGETDNVKAELSAWAELVGSNADLRTVFANPAIAHAGKERVLEQLITKTGISKTTANFLRIMLKNGRLAELTQVNDRFDAVLDERRGIVSAEITSARELPATEKTEFAANLERLTGKQVKIDFAVDENIIGGVVTRIGSTVYDGSVKTKLENLREQLVNG